MTHIDQCAIWNSIIEVIQKAVLLTMKVASHPSALLTCITQDDVSGIFEDWQMLIQLYSWLHPVLFLDHYYCFQLVQVIKDFLLSGQVFIMYFLNYCG